MLSCLYHYISRAFSDLGQPACAPQTQLESRQMLAQEQLGQGAAC